MSVTCQSWEVGTGTKAYQCVMDAGPYRWPQQQHHHQTESNKTNLSTLSMYINSSHETSEPNKSCVPQFTSPVSSSILRHGECGPVSTFVLPSSACSGGERVPLIGEESELVYSAATANGCLSWNSSGQRIVRNGCTFGPLKVHPREQHFDTSGQGLPPAIELSTDCLVLASSPSPSLFQDCVGPCLSSSSSSIGVAGEHSLSSSANGSDDNTDDGEVQSARRSSLNLSSLQDSLPIKRGLSRYFTGQSKSFGCLADALSSSLAKPVNPYALKRRRNVSLYDDRNRSFLPVSQKSASGISKKGTFGNRSNLALAVAMEATQEEEYDEVVGDNVHPAPLPSTGWGRPKNHTTSRANLLPDLQVATPPRSYFPSDLQGATPPARRCSLSDVQGAGRG